MKKRFSHSPALRCDLVLLLTIQGETRTTLTNPDCGPDCKLLNEFLKSYALEMHALRKTFEEQKKKEETKRTNLCSRIE